MHGSSSEAHCTVSSGSARPPLDSARRYRSSWCCQLSGPSARPRMDPAEAEAVVTFGQVQRSHETIVSRVWIQSTNGEDGKRLACVLSSRRGSIQTLRIELCRLRTRRPALAERRPGDSIREAARDGFRAKHSRVGQGRAAGDGTTGCRRHVPGTVSPSGRRALSWRPAPRAPFSRGARGAGRSGGLHALGRSLQAGSFVHASDACVE
jgi:hypothetical protein